MLPVLKLLGLVRAVCFMFSSFARSISVVLFERFAPCVQILWSLSSGSQIFQSFSSGLLLVSLFRVVCSFFLLVVFERFAPCSQVLHCLSSGLLLVFSEFYFAFRSALFLLVKILVSFACLALCSQRPESLSSGLLFVLQCSRL